MTVRDRAQAALKSLVGLTMARSTRASQWQYFHFFSSVPDEIEGIKGDWVLCIQCPWRICTPNEVLTGHYDVFEPPNENGANDPAFEWDVKGGNLRDVNLKKFFSERAPKVVRVDSDNYGGFELHMEEAFVLAAFPTMTRVFECGEHWRLFDNAEKDTEHFVVDTVKLAEWRA
ncbi:MAG: hypothetical protein WBG34_08055 [Flavobacteriales bacterium]